MHAGLEEYDCRLNRLAQLGLEQDGFAAAVAAARDRYGAGRTGVFIGTSTRESWKPSLPTGGAIRRPAPLPASFRYHATLNTYSLGDFIGRYFGLSGPSFVVSSACSSTAKVFDAARMIAAGRATPRWSAARIRSASPRCTALRARADLAPALAGLSTPGATGSRSAKAPGLRCWKSPAPAPLPMRPCCSA